MKKIINISFAGMHKGGFDPSWPLFDSQQSQCYPQFNVGRHGQIPSAKGSYPTSHLKTSHNISGSSGTLNRNRPCTQMRHRPWSPGGVDHFGRHISMVIDIL